MALKLGELFYDIDAKTNGLDKSKRHVDKTTAAMGSAFKKLGGIIAAAFTIETARRVLLLSDHMRSLRLSLSAFISDVNEGNKVFKDLINVSDASGSSLEDVVKQFEYLTNSMQDMGKTNDDLIKFLDNINKLGSVADLSGSDLSRTMRQISNALSENIVDQGKFNAALDRSPVIADQIAKGLGISARELRAMADSGTLLSRDVFQAILNQTGEINTKASSINLRLSEGINQFKNAIGQAALEFDNLTGASGNVSNGIADIAKFINNNFSDALINTMVLIKRMQLEFENTGSIISDLKSILDGLTDSDTFKFIADGTTNLVSTTKNAIQKEAKERSFVTRIVTSYFSNLFKNQQKEKSNQKELTKLREIDKDLLLERMKLESMKLMNEEDSLKIFGETRQQVELTIDAMEKGKKSILLQMTLSDEEADNVVKNEEKKRDESKKTLEQRLADYKAYLDGKKNQTVAPNDVDISDQSDKFKFIKTLSSGSFDDVMSATGSFTDQPDIKSDKNDTDLQNAINSLKTEEELLQESYDKKREIIEQNESLTASEKEKWMKRNENMFTKSMEQINKQQTTQEQQLTAMRQQALVTALASTSNLNNQILSEMERAGKEQTSLYKAMWYTTKAMQVVQMMANALVAGSNTAAAIPGPWGVAAGAVVTSTMMTQAGILAGMTMSGIQSPGGGRLSGGGVYPNTMHPVNEDGNPEMLVQGNRKFLLTGSKAGTVIPANKMEAKEGASNNPTVTIVNNGAPLQVESQTFSKDEVILLVKNAEESAVNRVNSSIGSGRGGTSQALNGRYSVNRKS